ncbi:DUF423 domain-containing protein [Chromatium okenii]|uniref:DUF423 domain-containing protein n=1 Tax=Chromatium okenii TaxID=61644 RepID=UPI001F5BD099|nr:DUF423 domain-containing protein [Chromatium okenii]
MQLASGATGNAAGWAFLLGSVLFSGSLYVMTLRHSATRHDHAHRRRGINYWLDAAGAGRVAQRRRNQWRNLITMRHTRMFIDLPLPSGVVARAPA